MAGEPQELPDKWWQPNVQHYAQNVFCVLVRTKSGSVMVGKFTSREAARLYRDELLIKSQSDTVRK